MSMVMLYKGSKGKGKTLTMTKDGWQYKKDGWRVLRNYNCKFGEYISNDEILKLNKESNIINAVLMIDEIQIFFDSRRSMRKQNLEFSNFIQQIRKRRIILLCTTQYSNTIDLRLRQHLDYMAYPRFFKELDVCEVTYEDLTALEDDFLLGNETKKAKIVYDAKPIYNLYDTEEMII